MPSLASRSCKNSTTGVVSGTCKCLLTSDIWYREIDRDEFKKVMNLMRTQNRHVSRHRDGRRHGFKVSGSVDNGGLLEYFFGKDGKACLEHGRFVKFLKDLHEEVCI